MSVQNTLDQRGKSYGDFSDNAKVAQELKALVRKGSSWNAMPPHMKEGLDMILSKVSRMVTADWTHEDNLIDIQGYAKLMQERLPKVEDKILSPKEKTGALSWAAVLEAELKRLEAEQASRKIENSKVVPKYQKYPYYPYDIYYL